jgi:hypothetical protein
MRNWMLLLLGVTASGKSEKTTVVISQLRRPPARPLGLLAAPAWTALGVRCTSR